MRIPLLCRGEYSQWRERFMNYLEEQTDGEAMINSIQNGDHPLLVVAQVSLAGTALLSTIPNFGLLKRKRLERLIDALERQMRGSEYGEQDRKAVILYEYETFKATEGEQLIDTYLRYLQVINDLNKCGYKKDNYELNYKFLNNLQLEWKQYGTLMRQTKNLMDITIDALYNILKQNQGDVNDAMGYKKKAVVVTSDPLALVAEKTKVSKRKEKVVVQLDSEGSDDEDISDLKKTTALLAKAFNRKKYYAKLTNNNLRTSSASSLANKKPEYVESEEKKEDKKADEKKRDMSKVKCYNCKKEGHFAKDCKKVKVKDYNYYKTKMLLAKKDSDEQVLLAEDQAWMESSSDSDQEINANMVFMAKMENVLLDSEEISSSAKETIAEVSYYTSDSESESEYETSEYYDNSTNYGLFVDNDDDQEIFHDAIESASENFNENHIVSQTDHDQSEVDHNDSEDKDHLVDKLIKFNQKIAKCHKRIEKANQQSKDLENKNKDLQDKYNVLKNQVNTFEEKNNEFNEQIKVLNETNVDLLAQTEVLQEQLKVKHVVIDTHTECQAQYAKLEEERYQYMIRYSALCDNDKQHRKKIDEQEILFDKMSRQLVEMNNNVLRLQEKILEKETKILELEECVRNKDLEIEKCLERLNDCENKLHKIGQTRQTIHMIMPSKDKMYNGRKGIGFENPSYFCKAKELRPSLYDERVIGLGYTPMFLTHSNEALEIEKFKRARENKIEFAYDYGNLNASYVNEKINFSDDYFQEIINPDFEKIDSPFQQTSSLKPYVPTVILEKIIIDLEDEVVSLLEKEKENLEIIESLKSKGSESSENAISDSENQSENDCHEVEKGCDNLENSNVIAPGMFKINVSQSVSPISAYKTSCASNNVENKTKRKRRKRTSSKQNDKQVNNDVLRANRDFVHFSDLDTVSSVRRPKHSGVIWKKKGSSNTSNVDLSSVSYSKLNKDVKRYSRKDLLSCNNSHHEDTRGAHACNDAMSVSCNSRLYASCDVNDLFVFDDVSIRKSQVSKMPFRKKPRDSLNVHSRSNSNKSLPRTVFRWLPKMQPLAEPVAKWIPKIVQICLWIIDSGCSKHMTGNRALLTNFVEKFLGTVRFGNNDFAVIAGYGDVVIGSMTIKKVYYVEGLGHNLFSVGQFCDKGLEVAFRKSTCFVRNEDGVDLLTGDRSSNLYTIALNEIVSNSSACLLAKASSSQSWLWHQRLSHLNFATINNLVKNNLVRGLPKMKFEKDHLCSACEQGKIHRKHHKSKTAFASNKPLYLLHMDLCGPMRVESINGKRYVLVVVDDYSRYTWVFFLHSKDEASEVIISFIKKTQVNLQLQVQRVRTDNGTEFKNKTLAKFFDEVGISQQFSAARTPQQNGVVERRNRTLVEAARTMLTFTNLPLFLWAEAIATACFTQNRSIIHKRFDKTPYELVNKRKPNIKFFHVFGCRCYLLNDYDDVGKLKAKGDIRVFVGYSKESAAFRIYNKQTRKIHESVNVNFDEISEMASKQFKISKKDLEDLFYNFYDEYFDSSKITKSSTTNVETSNNEISSHEGEVFHEVSDSFQEESSSSSLNDDVQQSSEEQVRQINVFDERLGRWLIFDASTYSMSLQCQTFYQPYPHEKKWTKNHPLHKIIGDPKSSVRTRGQLANSCLFACLLSSIEPANVAEALKDADWVSAMQDELDQFARLKVWRLVPRLKGLWYPKDSGFDLTAYSDADHAGCHLDRKTESEYVAVSGCCAQVLWMRTQLTDYGFFFDKVPIYCDSKSAIAISCNPIKFKVKDFIQAIKESICKRRSKLAFENADFEFESRVDTFRDKKIYLSNIGIETLYHGGDLLHGFLKFHKEFLAFRASRKKKWTDYVSISIQE
ncbi:retrovirus-related pol polyprotein from transposon TNT 1-94 [Tanacetum coccineum]